MKRTTYIMIALLVAGLLLTSGFAFYLTLETPSPERTELGASGTEQVRPLPVCKSVRLYAVGNMSGRFGRRQSFVCFRYGKLYEG